MKLPPSAQMAEAAPRFGLVFNPRQPESKNTFKVYLKKDPEETWPISSLFSDLIVEIYNAPDRQHVSVFEMKEASLRIRVGSFDRLDEALAFVREKLQADEAAARLSGGGYFGIDYGKFEERVLARQLAKTGRTSFHNPKSSNQPNPARKL